MPLIPSTHRVESRTTTLHDAQALTYGTPAIGYLPDGKPFYYCAPTATKCLGLARRGGFFYYEKSGYKNVPYRPSVHNSTPLPYDILKYVDKYPVLHTKGLVITHDASGGGADQCGPTVANANRYGSDGPGPSYPPLPVTTSMRNHVVAKANGKLADKKSVTVNWANFVGEQRDSRHLIYQSLDDMIRTVRHLRKGRFERAYRQLFGNPTRGVYDYSAKQWKWKGHRGKRDASRLWLEWTYGWSPLVGDVYDAIQDMKRNSVPLILNARASVIEQSTTKTSAAISFGLTTTGLTASVPFDISLKKYTKFSISVNYRVLNTILSDLNSAGIVNPLETAWELTPFSFVADWFINVGDWLRNASIGTGLQFLHGSETTIQRVEAVSIRKYANMQARRPGYQRAFGMGLVDYSSESLQVKRLPLSSPPSMSLHINHNVLSVSRIVSAAALLKTLLSKW